MLHVLLLILKIIGIMLAVLLGILLLFLLLALFVPVRYEASLRRREGEGFLAKGRVSWLLRMLTIPVAFQDGELSIHIRLFGLTIKNRKETEEELSRGAEDFFAEAGEDAKEDAADGFQEFEQREQPEEKREAEALPKEKPEASNGEDDACLEYLEKSSDTVETEPEDLSGNSPGFFQKLWDRLRAIPRILSRILKKIRNLKYTFRRFCVKIKRVIKKIQKTKAFLTDERTKAAVHTVWREAKVLLRHALPRRVRGDVHFGAGDPALTGEILGGISIFYPIFMDNVKVLPDFEKRCLEGELLAKGRVQLAVILWMLLRLLMDKNIRYVYRKLA